MTFQAGTPGPRDMASSNMSTIYDLWTTDGGEFVAAVVLLGKFRLDWGSILPVSLSRGRYFGRKVKILLTSKAAKLRVFSCHKSQVINSKSP